MISGIIQKRKIVLINPITGIYSSLYKTLPLSLLTISEKLDQKKYDIILIDQIIPGWKKKLKNIVSNQKIIVGITALTGYQLYFGSLIAKFIKNNNKEAKIIFGGIHPTSLPSQTLKENFVDYLVIGEGENVFPKLIKALANNKNLKKIKGIGYKDQNKIIINPPDGYIDLSKSKNLSYNLVNVKEYLKGTGDVEFYVEGGRGCPYNCSFCYNPARNRNTWRPRNAKKIIEEIKKIKDKFRANSFFIIDDSFFISRKRVLDFVSLLKERNISINWSCEANISSLTRLDEITLKKLADSGLKWISIGIESGSKRIQKLLNKEVDIESLILFNKRISNFPINIRYNFITGTPFEKKKDVLKTIKLINRLLRENTNCMIQPIYILVPFPGTKYLEQCKHFGFQQPRSVKEWFNFDPFTISRRLPWMKRKNKKMFELIMYSSFFIDKKLEYHLTDSFFGKIIKLLSRMYRPLALFRFNNLFYHFYFEKEIIKFINAIYNRVIWLKMLL